MRLVLEFHSWKRNIHNIMEQTQRLGLTAVFVTDCMKKTMIIKVLPSVRAFELLLII